MFLISLPNSMQVAFNDLKLNKKCEVFGKCVYLGNKNCVDFGVAFEILQDVKPFCL